MLQNDKLRHNFFQVDNNHEFYERLLLVHESFYLKLTVLAELENFKLKDELRSEQICIGLTLG